MAILKDINLLHVFDAIARKTVGSHPFTDIHRVGRLSALKRVVKVQ